MKARLEDFIGRAALLLIFGFFALLATHRLDELLSNPWATDTWLIELIVRIASFALVVPILGATIARLPAKGTASGWEPRISAIIGTFLTATLVVMPKGEISFEARRIAGVLVLGGTLLSIHCHYWLGRSFPVMAHARRLVTSGPYSIVRHPLYAAEMITLIGVTISNWSLAATIVVAATIAVQFRRMPNEERGLRATFPEYEDYARSVPMIVPALSGRVDRRRLRHRHRLNAARGRQPPGRLRSAGPVPQAPPDARRSETQYRATSGSRADAEHRLRGLQVPFSERTWPLASASSSPIFLRSSASESVIPLPARSAATLRSTSWSPASFRSSTTTLLA